MSDSDSGYLCAVQMVISGYLFSPIKIGRSIDPHVRLKAYAGAPFPVRILGSWRVDDAPLAERMIHKLFAQYRLNGEWFYPAFTLVQLVEENTGAEISAGRSAISEKAKQRFQERLFALFPDLPAIERERALPGHAKPYNQDIAISDGKAY